MDVMERFIDQDRYARFLGVEICEWGEGHAKAKLELAPQSVLRISQPNGAEEPT